jgi:hypothetical protein
MIQLLFWEVVSEAADGLSQGSRQPLFLSNSIYTYVYRCNEKVSFFVDKIIAIAQL